MPPPIQSHNIPLPTTGHINILYHRASPPPLNKPTILCLPFWGGSASTYLPLLALLALQHPSIPSLAVSYRGTGLSPAPIPDTPEKHDIPSLAADAFEVLHSEFVQDLIGMARTRSVLLVAHSMSAKVVYTLLSLLQQRRSDSREEQRIAISGLLLLAPAPPTPLVLPEAIRAQQLTAYTTPQSAEYVVRNVLTHANLPVATYRALAADAAGMSAGAKRGWVERGMGRDCTEVLRGLVTLPEVRVRVLVGREDKVETVERVEEETVRVLREMLGGEVGVRVRVLEGVGHLVPVEAAEEVVGELGEMIEG